MGKKEVEMLLQSTFKHVKLATDGLTFDQFSRDQSNFALSMVRPSTNQLLINGLAGKL